MYINFKLIKLLIDYNYKKYNYKRFKMLSKKFEYNHKYNIKI